MVVKDGKVGFGTASPNATLEVNGDALINGLTVGRGGGNDTTNTSLGFKALGHNGGVGRRNTAVGSRALLSNTTGNFNTANGFQALLSNTTGTSNTANGVSALRLNMTGSNNTANGISALENNTNGNSNTANGISALQNNTIGSSNTANGTFALLSNTTGSNNTANGISALLLNTTGTNNTAIGAFALVYNTTGGNNTANGLNALRNNTTGSGNVGIGDSAGLSNSVYNSCTFLGTNADASVNNLTNATAIGANAIVGASNSLVLGDASVKVGIGISAPAFKLQVSTNSAAKPTSNTWTIASDARLKTNVHDYNDGLIELKKIHPVWFTYTGEAGMPKETGVGVLAQELKEVAPYMVGNWTHRDKDNKGTDYLSVDNGPMMYMLINSVKELAEKNENKDAKIDELQKQIDELKALMQQLLNTKSTAPCLPLANK